MKPGLRCQHCKAIDRGKVIETIKVEDGVRRRYRCAECDGIFPSYEYVGVKQLLVKKRNDRNELFKREKVREGIVRAFAKLDIEDSRVEALTDRVCESIRMSGVREVTSEEIGLAVLNELLHDGDDPAKVAFLRFASVFFYVRDYETFETLVADTTEKLKRLSEPVTVGRS